MRTLRLLLYVVIGCALAWFAMNNWTWVELSLVPGSQLIVRLPALLFFALVVGALPGAILHGFSRWRWKREIARAQRQRDAAVAETASRAVVEAEPAVALQPAPAEGGLLKRRAGI